MKNYYDQLSADRLRQVYELAPPRVKQYLDSEISFVREHLHPDDLILELGCGYGRVIGRLNAVSFMVGIDTSAASLRSAKIDLGSVARVALAQMNAVSLGFPDKTFDCVICIQNGISAFHVDPGALIRESLRVTKPGGQAFFSSYTEGFWDFRLEWFRVQAEYGLLGAIDWEKTGNGTIVCKDGFTATTFDREDFGSLLSSSGLHYEICEVDDSSLFCRIQV